MLFWIFVLIVLKNIYETNCTTFPSVAICLTKHRIGDEFWNALHMRFPGKQKISYRDMKALYNYFYVKSTDTYIGPLSNSSWDVDILDLRRELFPRTCKEFFDQVYFTGKLIPDCEKIFKFHELEHGYCFLANNYMDYDSAEQMPLQYSSSEKNPVLRLVLRPPPIYNYEYYVQSNEDLPNFNSSGYSISYIPKKDVFKVVANPNSKSINEPISKRQCRFPNESTIKGYPYSRSTCMGNILSEIELEKCNCTLFSYSDQSSKNFCGIEGVDCVGKKARHWSLAPAFTPCLPSCVHRNVVFDAEKTKTRDDLRAYLIDIEIESPL
ncbi:uncharacterized protein ppk29 isoform X2 [Drosophila takahashii]|uniref:uncharacterized protein ppk29 isoform X2 n=1 Tax=Drosophila takahashii TaxID=29030 RepID=UPI003899310E